MPRSGSTWLYNAARLILLQSEPDLGCGWIDDWLQIPKKSTLLLKVHDYQPAIANKAWRIIYSYRDLRDALASRLRKFQTLPTLATAKHIIENDYQWKQKAHYIMRYEDMIQDPIRIIRNLADCLEVDSIDPVEINQRLAALTDKGSNWSKESYDPETLFHRNHITHGGVGTWQDSLSLAFVKKLENIYHDWFKKYKYEKSR